VILGILPEGALCAGLSNRSDYDLTAERAFCKMFFFTPWLQASFLLRNRGTAGGVS